MSFITILILKSGKRINNFFIELTSIILSSHSSSFVIFFIPGTVTSFFSSYHHILHYISHANTTRKLWQQSLCTLFNFNQILQCHYSMHQHLLNFHKALRPYLYRFSIPTYYNLLVLMSLKQKFTHHKKIRNQLLFYMRFS